MKIPKNVKIGGIVYNVNQTKNTVTLGNQVCYGVIDYDSAHIDLQSNVSKQHMERTLLHEILHGIAHDRDIELGDETENIIDAFAKGLHALIIDNPNLF